MPKLTIADKKRIRSEVSWRLAHFPPDVRRSFRTRFIREAIEWTRSAADLAAAAHVEGRS